ncbi:TRAP transporter large permease [Rhizobium sp. CG5]|uniref:TRAP transporter large permease n=1 Tax=Rhizobium sp. CG5 TaxID=2726076 RepID=UPI002034692F|nr:TRAP transporter large permease [Rhizobium sp. CG5]MCM2472414.1 TRAP transporter large permease [Rhizobium sp. CG5]
MDPLYIGALGFLVLFVLIILKIPIAIAMMLVGVTAFALQTSWTSALTLLVGDPAASMTSVDMAVVPLFLLMGICATSAGLSRDIYLVAASFLGHRRGGLAYATIAGCAAFGAVCGSSTATTATFTKIALPEMLGRNYSPQLATGSIAAGGALKALIPPSLVMILYSIATNTFILDLFLAAIVPVCLVILLNLGAIWVTTRRHPEMAPILEPVAWAERKILLRKAAPALTLIVCVFGGLYSGIFTVNEAASVAAVLTVAFALVRSRFNLKATFSGMFDATNVAVMVYMVIAGASVFSYFMTLARVPESLVDAIGLVNAPPILIVFGLLAAYLVLGAVFDEISAMIITLPFVLPVIVELGYDPIWWGIMNVLIVELGLIIPPIGLGVFIIHGLAPQIRLSEIYRGVVPFIIADLILLVLLALFPQIVLAPLTWLRS